MLLGYSEWYKKYLFYAMLKKEFNFENDFNELDAGAFGTKYKDVKYFGIEKNSDSKLYDQVEVLYYNAENDFAIILNTKEGEQVILCRGAEGGNFATIYNNIMEKAEAYTGNKKFTKNDFLKVPNIKFNTRKEFNELCNKEFLAKDGGRCTIEQAIQTIELEMDKSGGKLKSEAAIVMTKEMALMPEEENRYFYLNDEFTMFLKENGKDMNFADILEDEKASVTRDVEFKNLQNDINMVVSTLKEREQEVVRLRYGLGDGDRMTLEEIGNLYGVTKECIRQTELRALKKLRSSNLSQELLTGYID